MRAIKFRAWNKREKGWEQEHSCYGIGLDGTIIPATPCVTPIRPFNKDICRSRAALPSWGLGLPAAACFVR